jgi:hypothetical protein
VLGFRFHYLPISLNPFFGFFFVARLLALLWLLLDEIPGFALEKQFMNSEWRNDENVIKVKRSVWCCL